MTRLSGAVSNPWRYTGQYQDAATGLYKMGARYYQPDLGRWTQQDPSGLDANTYAYVGGNPVNFVDPSGLAAEFEDCFIFRYNDENGSCFGGNTFEVLGNAFDDVGGLMAIPGCSAAATAGAVLGGVAGAFAVGAGAAFGAPTGAALGCVGYLGVVAAFNREFVE